ncbi:PorT family protein [Sediminibacterium roseum]|uniref:PorT family protein n=1 Tax=Sediminibacterium roseum TaxID=1978412 RepID=A0ABW9ZN23_9BACT|nr:outer membrane beta-barrel protein [Sediminibacterium roseum]NCI48479.1 PorT family protein [Sediminibacterium roseum]
MKRLLCAATCLLVAGMSYAQTDTTRNNSDTVKVGNFIIIKKKNGANSTTSDDDNRNRRSSYEYRIERKPRRRSNISTNWWIVDLGFANWRDQTDYAAANAGGYFKTLRPANGAVNENSTKLITGKSSNVNIWLFIQKLNLIKHVVNLKYGLGLEMYNFRFDNDISYRKDPQPYAFNDSISFTKNKLYVEYLTVPIMLNFNTTPDSRRGLSFSAGVSAGYLTNSRNKQVSGERGKQKYRGDFNFEPWRVAAIGEIGLGPVRLYGSYSLNRLQKEVTRVEQYPYTVGIRFSNW